MHMTQAVGGANAACSATDKAQLEHSQAVAGHQLTMSSQPGLRVSQHLRERVAKIPSHVLVSCKPAVAKPVVHPPQAWKLSDALTRDPVQFLTEVFYFATVTGQDAVSQLMLLSDGAMREAGSNLLTANPPPYEVRWERACEIWLSLIGRDIYSPEHDASIKLSRGDIKQGNMSVLEYSMHFRVATMHALPMPPIVLCDAFLRGLKPSLAPLCQRTEQGALWDNLDALIAYALGKESTLPKPVHAGAAAGYGHGSPGKTSKSKIKKFKRYSPYPLPPPFPSSPPPHAYQAPLYPPPPKKKNNRSGGGRGRGRGRKGGGGGAGGAAGGAGAAAGAPGPSNMQE